MRPAYVGRLGARPVFAVGDPSACRRAARRRSSTRGSGCRSSSADGIVWSWSHSEVRWVRSVAAARRPSSRRHRRMSPTRHACSTRRSPTSTGGPSRRHRAHGFDAPSGALARVALGPADGPRVVLVPGRDRLEGGLRADDAALRGGGLSGRVLRPRRAVRVVGRRAVEPRPAAHRATTSGCSSTTCSRCSTTARRARTCSATASRHPRRARAARPAGPVREPHPAERPARAGAGVPRREAHRADQRPHVAAPGRRADALGHPQQPQQGAAAPPRVRARAVRAHPPRERRRHHRPHDADARRAHRTPASPVPKLVAVGEHDLWPRELHERVRTRDRGPLRGVSHRPQPLRDGAAPARARHDSRCSTSPA